MVKISMRTTALFLSISAIAFVSLLLNPIMAASISMIGLIVIIVSLAADESNSKTV
jgi:hypothetical protein